MFSILCLNLTDLGQARLSYRSQMAGALLKDALSFGKNDGGSILTGEMTKGKSKQAKELPRVSKSTGIRENLAQYCGGCEVIRPIEAPALLSRPTEMPTLVTEHTL